MTQLERVVRANLLLFCTQKDEIYVPNHKLSPYNFEQVKDKFCDEYDIRTTNGYTVFKDKSKPDSVKESMVGLASSAN